MMTFHPQVLKPWGIQVIKNKKVKTTIEHHLENKIASGKLEL
jgi:hypothetical protein